MQQCFHLESQSKITLIPAVEGIDGYTRLLRTLPDTAPASPQNPDNSTRMGFEPTRGDPNGLAVHRLNHSATSSGAVLPLLKLVPITTPSNKIRALRTKMARVRNNARSSDSAFIWKAKAKSPSFLRSRTSTATRVCSERGLTRHPLVHKTPTTRRGWDSNPRGETPMD